MPIGNLKDDAFDVPVRSYPAEQFPVTLVSDGIPFKLGPTADGQENALACHGQTLPIPAGAKRVSLLAASTGDAKVTFTVGNRPVDVTVQDWHVPIGGGTTGCGRGRSRN